MSKSKKLLRYIIRPLNLMGAVCRSVNIYKD